MITSINKLHHSHQLKYEKIIDKLTVVQQVVNNSLLQQDEKLQNYYKFRIKYHRSPIVKQVSVACRSFHYVCFFNGNFFHWKPLPLALFKRIFLFLEIFVFGKKLESGLKEVFSLLKSNFDKERELMNFDAPNIEILKRKTIKTSQ